MAGSAVPVSARRTGGGGTQEARGAVVGGGARTPTKGGRLTGRTHDIAGQKMLDMIDQMQTRDSLRMYNTLVERCFADCVHTFRRKTLEKDEEACVNRCAQKFLKHSARVSLRFAELNQEVQPGQTPPPQ